MYKIALFLALMVFSALPAPASAAEKAMSIAVVVNEDAITLSDVNDRLKLIVASSGLPATQEIRDRLLPQVIGALVEEQIKLQEAHRLELGVSKAEIDEGFAQIAAQNKFTPEQFRAMIKQGGLNIATMESQIKSQIAWAKVVQAKVRPKIIVSDSDIDTYIDRLNAASGKNEYLVSEIFLPVENQKEQMQVQELANRLVQETRSGKAPFFKVAQQFSQSAGANGGGDLGWVREGQLAPELDEALPQIGSGKISTPIRTLSGYHILLVREQRIISKDTIPDREGALSVIGTERLERQARRYLMDLKSSAFIENRLES
ncbi:MAG: peptidylprolyl isomerase [Alphaproteobacteria bacterium]|nr:peptidylprolyl isomerase [Alphaproteobacteria bacterium]